MASPWGFGPTSMLRATRSAAGSITLTVEAPSLDTYTFRPSGVITRPCGPLGTGIVATRRPCAGSITAPAPSLNSPTYTFGAGAAAGPLVAPSQSPVPTIASHIVRPASHILMSGLLVKSCCRREVPSPPPTRRAPLGSTTDAEREREPIDASRVAGDEGR